MELAPAAASLCLGCLAKSRWFASGFPFFKPRLAGQGLEGGGGRVLSPLPASPAVSACLCLPPPPRDTRFRPLAFWLRKHSAHLLPKDRPFWIELSPLKLTVVLQDLRPWW